MPLAASAARSRSSDAAPTPREIGAAPLSTPSTSPEGRPVQRCTSDTKWPTGKQHGIVKMWCR